MGPVGSSSIVGSAHNFRYRRTVSLGAVASGRSFQFSFLLSTVFSVLRRRSYSSSLSAFLNIMPSSNGDIVIKLTYVRGSTALKYFEQASSNASSTTFLAESSAATDNSVCFFAVVICFVGKGASSPTPMYGYRVSVARSRPSKVDRPRGPCAPGSTNHSLLCRIH